LENGDSNNNNKQPDRDSNKFVCINNNNNLEVQSEIPETETEQIRVKNVSDCISPQNNSIGLAQGYSNFVNLLIQAKLLMKQNSDFLWTVYV
jgi:hypothetical protein